MCGELAAAAGPPPGVLRNIRFRVNDEEGVAEGNASYARSIARILDGSGMVVGAGFLVAPDVVATCAHVVNVALDRDPADERMPRGLLPIDFPMSEQPGEPPTTVIARVSRWSPIRDDGTGDVALLRLAAVRPGARVPPLRGSGDLWNHRFRVLGFPADMVDGVWATGRIRGMQGTGWLQMQGAATDQGIDEGYSGSPVWDSTIGAVVGMTVARARDRATTTAYVLPMAQILGLDPELLPCPYRGLAPFEEEHAKFFHGRGDDVERLVAAAVRHPIVAVAGRSGTGKSSLVRAGLLPLLRRDGTAVVECRTAPGMAASEALALALTEALKLDPDTLAQRLVETAGSPNTARDLVERADGRLVVVMDQFEEIVAADPEQARVVLAQVVALATARPDRLRAVLTLRWESLGDLLTGDLAAMFEDSTVFVTEMSRRQLREAIVRPAEHAPGLCFEEGLVTRILDDADTEPGRLPLVESLLTELWSRRSGGSLTMHEYDVLGGVSGALVQLAEDATRAFVGLGELQRLLTQLARPVDDGFVRRPVAFDRLEPELQEIARRLAEGRLVVLGSAPGGTVIVELAHQALIDHWPRLRRWLVEDRDFLSWRQGLETRCQQWKDTEQDPDALLRGAALATALEWTRTRAGDIPDEAFTFIELSHRRQRRDVHRWRAVTAVLAVLVLATGALAGVAVKRGDRIRSQLDAANAESLSELAAQRASADPVSATQFALAAFRSAPVSLTARVMLAREELSMRSVDAVFPELSTTTIANVLVSDDGRRAVLLAGQTISLVTGLAGRTPVRRDLPDVPKGTNVELSPDGRWLAGVGPDNAVLVWDLSRPSGPTVLAKADGGHAPDGMPVTLVAFSPNSRRLAWLNGSHLTVRDLDRGTDTEHKIAPARSLSLTDDPGQVVLGHGGEPGARPQTMVIRALSGGRSIRTLPAGSIMAAHGVAVLTCTKGNAMDRAQMTVTASATGRRIARFPLLSEDCPTIAELDTAGSGFLVENVPTEPGSVARMVRVTDLRTGRSYDASTPPATELSATTPLPSVFQGTNGPVLLLARSGSVLRIRVSADWFSALPSNSTGELTTDDRYVVSMPLDVSPTAVDTIVVRDRASGTPLGRLTVPADSNVAIGAENALLVAVRQQTGVRMMSYSLPALHPKRRYTLPMPAGAPGKPDVIAREQDGRFTVVAAGTLAVWNSDTGQMIGVPMRLGPSWARARFRPGHPHQIAVYDGDGSLRLWDAQSRDVVATVPVHADTATAPAFDITGGRVAAITSQHTLRVWSLRTGRPDGPAIPVPDYTRIVGFTADGYLLISDQLSATVTVMDFHRGRPSDPLTLPASAVDEEVENGQSLLLGNNSSILPIRFPVIARRWFGDLCDRLDRPFTHAERALLPPGAAATRPCA